MSMDKISTYEYKGKGYNPYLIDKYWQIAQLNYVEGQGFYDLIKIEKHVLTDEAFILNKGNAVLIAAEITGDEVTFELEVMSSGVVYNIPKGVWHNIGLSEDAELFIVENSNTHQKDVTYFSLSESQCKELNRMIKEALCDIK